LARFRARVRTEREERRRKAAHQRGWNVVTAVVNGEVGRASSSVLHDKGHVEDVLQHQKEGEERLAW
jgi:hypothetical protein